MKTVKRFDKYSLSEKPVRTPEGYLRVPAFATRVGVLTYRGNDGKPLRELRLPEEVFNPDSMQTLSGVPITNDHPKGLLDSENATEHMVGFTGETVTNVDDKFVKVMANIVDAKSIQDVDNGKAEVSCGYKCDLEESPGVWNGEPYDLIQRNIRYNHLAITPRGRAGREVRLRLDSDEAILSTDEESKTMKIMLGGKEWEVPEDLGAALVAEMDSVKADAQKAKDALNVAPKPEQMVEMQKSLDQATAKADALDAEIKQLKSQPASRADSATITAEGRAFAKALVLAQKLNVEKADEMNDKVELMKAIIKADGAETDLSKQSDTYIQARFDIIAERVAKNDAAAGATGRAITGGARQTEKADSEGARERYLQRLRGEETK